MNTICSIMSSPVISTSPDTFGHEAMVTMLEHEINSLLVEDNGEIVGIFTNSDWDRRVVRGDGNVNSEKVGSVMTKTVITIEKSETLSTASLLMKENRMHHIVVTEGEKL